MTSQEKKENFFGHKKQNFSKGITHAFGQKMPLFLVI